MTSRRWTNINVDKLYCDCGEVKKPVRLKFDKEENGVFLAKLLQGKKILQTYGIIFQLYRT